MRYIPPSSWGIIKLTTIFLTIALYAHTYASLESSFASTIEGITIANTHLMITISSTEDRFLAKKLNNFFNRLTATRVYIIPLCQI